MYMMFPFSPHSYVALNQTKSILHNFQDFISGFHIKALIGKCVRVHSKISSKHCKCFLPNQYTKKKILALD